MVFKPFKDPGTLDRLTRLRRYATNCQYPSEGSKRFMSRMLMSSYSNCGTAFISLCTFKKRHGRKNVRCHKKMFTFPLVTVTNMEYRIIGPQCILTVRRGPCKAIHTAWLSSATTTPVPSFVIVPQVDCSDLYQMPGQGDTA